MPSRFSACLFLTTLISLTAFSLPVTSSQEQEQTNGTATPERDLLERVYNPSIIASTPYFKIFNGTAAIAGGGYIVGIVSGSGIYAVIHGNESHPNAPRLIHYSERPVAVAEIKPPDKPYVSERLLITLKTLLTTSITHLLEFNDRNGDSLFSIRQSGAMGPPFIPDEPEKLLNLSRSNWQSRVSGMTVNNDSALFNITVTAQDVPYTREWMRSGAGNDSVDEIKFTIAFNFTLSDTSAPNIPIFEFIGGEVKLKRTISEVVKVKNLECSTKYSVKITGWDFTDSEGLIYLMTGITLSEMVEVKGLPSVPPLLAKNTGLRPEIQYSTLEGQKNASYDFPKNDEVVHKIQGKLLDIRNSQGRLGYFGWKGNYTVDGTTKETVVQLDGFFRREDSGIARSGLRSFSTLVVTGGFIYAAGNTIEHDPELKSISFFFQQEPHIIPPAVRETLLNNSLILFAATTAFLVAFVIWLKRH
ncbi:MAG: hypothetical protein ACFFD4_28560 [Candidatus Odinarchaeota archaeon]